MTEIYVYTNTGRVFRIVENDEGKVSIITNGQIVYEDKPAVEMVSGEINLSKESQNSKIL
jgi:hypothetical protein